MPSKPAPLEAMDPVATCFTQEVRCVLIEAAHRLARFDRRWRALAQRWRQTGKPGSVVAAAIANRWVRWLFHQMQTTKSAA
jgi:hypothetical protein